jgi:hypothetical protein
MGRGISQPLGAAAPRDFSQKNYGEPPCAVRGAEPVPCL